MKFSILTATYNRAGYLNRLYESIKKNISENYDIEWLIMDDGSDDGTKEICDKLKQDQEIEIKYFFQENSGKMKAINKLSDYVCGELWIECDSDDYFVENTFRGILDEYNKIKEKENIYALAYLKRDQDGNNMGKKFNFQESTMFDLYFKEGEDGEKALVFISDIRKQYRYELEENERFITESRMYHKMDKEYKIKCINQYIMVCEYQKDGYTKNIRNQFLKYPKGYYMYFYEILHDMNMSSVKFSKRIYAIKHYILFTYLTQKKLDLGVKGIRNKILILLLYVPGILKSKKFKR